MRDRRLGMTALATGLVACVALALPATGIAQKKGKPRTATTTVSSGPLVAPIPDADFDAPGNEVQNNTRGFLRSPITPALPGRARVTDVDVQVRLDHTLDADLDIALASPRGIVDLSTDNGGNGDNYGAGATNCTGTFTTFDTNAGSSIILGTAPFAATFAPEESLAGLNGLLGRNIARTPWSLIVVDDIEQQTGTLYCWQLVIDYRVAPKPSKVK